MPRNRRKTYLQRKFPRLSHNTEFCMDYTVMSSSTEKQTKRTVITTCHCDCNQQLHCTFHYHYKPAIPVRLENELNKTNTREKRVNDLIFHQRSSGNHMTSLERNTKDDNERVAHLQEILKPNHHNPL